MHSNVTIKNVSWPHFSWATLYIMYGSSILDVLPLPFFLVLLCFALTVDKSQEQCVKYEMNHSHIMFAVPLCLEKWGPSLQFLWVAWWCNGWDIGLVRYPSMPLPGDFWDRWPHFECKLSLDIITTRVNSALHPSWVAKLSTSFGWGQCGKVTAAGWQVTLCDSIWHVISRSGVVISITNCYTRFTSLWERRPCTES